MSKRIFDTPLADLLPESIRHDAGIAAAAQALDPALRGLVLGVPNLLLFSRLDPNPGQLSPVMQRLTDAAGGLNPLSEAELELLAWQFHVDFRDAARNSAELAAMVRDSIPWHRIKGTPAAVRLAVGIMGLTPTIEEDGRGEDWATFQLGFDTPLNPDDIPRLLTLVNLSKPVRCRLRRIYSGYDLRPLILDRHFGLDRNYLDGESGIFYPDQDLVVSFGYRVRSQVLPEARTPFSAWLESCSVLVDYLKTYQLDRFRLDVPLLQSPMLNAAHIESLEVEATDHSHVIDYGRSVSRVQLALDWTRLDGVNARLDRPHMVRVGNPVRLDSYRLDASIDRRVIPIHELFHDLVRHAATERTVFDALTQGDELFCGEIFFDLHNPRHRGQQLDNVLLDSPRRERFGLADGRLQADFVPEPQRWFDTAYPSREISRSQFALDACRLDGGSQRSGKDGGARFDGPQVVTVANPVALDRYRLDASISKTTRPLPYMRVELARMGVVARVETAPLWAETGFAPASVPAEIRKPVHTAHELACAVPKNLPLQTRSQVATLDSAVGLDTAYIHGRPFDAVASFGGAETASILAVRDAAEMAPQLVVSQVEGIGDTERVPPALWASGWTARPWIKYYTYLHTHTEEKP